MSPKVIPYVERRLLDYSIAAAYLGISIRKMKEIGGPNGVIPQVKIDSKVLFDRADLDAYIERLKAAS